MSRERWYEVAVCAAVAVAFAGFWLVAAVMSDAPTGGYLASAVLVAIVAAPWVVAAWLLWRAYWRRVGPAVAGLDAPARAVAAAAAALPAGRREWGAAMVAELAHVPGRVARWRFAAGCLRAALYPARGAGVPVLATGAVAALAVAGASFGVGAAVPPLRAFAVTFVALAGAWPPSRWPAPAGCAGSCRLRGSLSPGSPAWSRASRCW
jgi:hypothetical protein